MDRRSKVGFPVIFAYTQPVAYQEGDPMAILVIGDFIIDEYLMGTSSRLSPEAPVPVVCHQSLKLFAGGAANVALNIKAMGSTVKLISQCDDQTNLDLLGDLDHTMIACDLTPHKTRVLSDGHMICRIDREQYQPLGFTPAWLGSSTEICVISDYNKGSVTNSHGIISACADRGIKTIVDPKRDWDHYSGAWLLKANAQELRQQAARDFSMADLPSICSSLAAEYGIRNLVITLGSEGLFAWTPDGYRFFPAQKQAVADVTGAGDVVIAALAHYIHQGEELLSAAGKANQLAGRSVTQLGTYVVQPEDLAAVEERVVFTNGCFDVLHRGHVEYLRRSRQLGTRLIVGVNSDRSVRQLKGPSRPINRAEDRKALLESLGCVDEVIIFDEPTPRELIQRIKPDIITKGGDYTVDQVVGNDLVNQVVIIPYVDGYSTTNMLRKADA
jgi:D-beta-D-heptose 7-phosphate kinase/D-beta-D-heptose 1-phosphate adenosyltransferase